MSDKDRKKKHGQDASKKRQRMRAAVSERQRTAAPPRESRDEGDTVLYKPGSAADRRQRPQARHDAA